MPRLTRRHLLAAAPAVALAPKLGLAANATPATSASPAPGATPTSAQLEQINAVILDALKKVGAPGASVSISSADGAAIDTAVGLADVAQNTPMTPDCHFRIGSITKSFTATRFLMLVDSGAVSLDDVLAERLPQYAFLPNADVITMRNLLNMQSGLPEYTASDAFLKQWTADPTHPFKPSELVEMLKGAHADAEPGTTFAYCNTNYLLVGDVIASIVQSDIATIIQRDVIDAAGLKNTYFPTDTAIPLPAAHGYAYASADAGTPSASPMASPAATPAASPAAATPPMDVTELSPSGPGAAGAMISTASDVHRWMTMVVEGTLLSKETHKEMTTFSAKGDGLEYGMGLFKAGELIGHNGIIDGFVSLMFFAPATKVSGAILVNAIPTASGDDPTLAILKAISGM